tara:strand:- start:146 stop:451 length:306 start_codon:yes stop_codon:yes gene_type:complete
MEKCFKIMNEKGQTMTPCGKWWYDEWSPKFKDQPVDIKYNWEIYYTDTIKNAFSDLEGQQKGYYNIVECESDGRGDVTPIVDDSEDLKVTRCYYNGGKIAV